MALPNTIRYKARDIWDIPEDGNRYEVIDGQLHMTPPPIPEHQGAAGVLYLRIGSYVEQWQLGRVYFAPIGVVLDDLNGLQPDLIYISRERLGIIGDKAIKGAPDLAAEILSPSTCSRDRGVKMRRYAAAGVSHYWIVDPRTRTLEEYVLVEGGYELAGKYGPDSTFRPALFPGLAIAIDDLWA